MIPRDQLPEDAEDWKDVNIHFSFLPKNAEESCPASREEIMEYVQMESGDTDDASEESLSFVRTALVEKNECWLWKYVESDGEIRYVTFWKMASEETILGLSSANGLSPEQFILAEYYDEVYW